MAAALAVEALVILALLTALLWGQPTQRETDRQLAITQATQITWLSTTVAAIPTPTRVRSTCTSYYYSC